MAYFLSFLITPETLAALSVLAIQKILAGSVTTI